MLPAEHRLREPELFRLATRRGRRSGNSELVVHAVTGEEIQGTLVGFVVPKRVYPRAVDRNRTKRQLRHLMRERLVIIPDQTLVVVRALPGIRGRSFAEIETSLDSALTRTLAKLKRFERERMQQMQRNRGELCEAF
ncbi:ribonuclease P protein component [Gleimia hominis]|uniref:Ribonuclease P protein component n=1 Tax=Gleimia hominis TaxID=595468 RepID=A0ABU3I8S9_9ACTO|nr:ribonuclease P protein component [Gleimia hominis]MDT3766785.1 ribonuclease P protein component [Gleimia hominis]